MGKRLRIALPVAAVVLFLFGGWTLRNKLATGSAPRAATS
jgi:hypothetical protein